MSERSHPRRCFVLLLASGAVPLGGCRKPEAPKPARARFGVLFGGEIQEREEVPLILDRARQSIGIRIEFAEPEAGTVPITWELEKPAASKDAGAGGAGIVDYGQARTRPGEATLDIPLAFRAGDRIGNWRVRVKLGDTLLLDRGFRVVLPAPPPPSEE